ncbi:MAG: flagellar biosynthesis protein FlhF [Rubrivivax sp.]
MNLKRFTARTSRDALAMVRQAFGDDAVVMSTRPCADGVEMLAMAPESVAQLERVGAAAQAYAAPRLPQPVATDRAEDASETNADSPPRALLRSRLEKTAATPPAPTTLRERLGAMARRSVRVDPHLDADDSEATQSHVQHDVEQLQMSTLSFQDYVRDRMLRRREVEREAQQDGRDDRGRARPVSERDEGPDTESMAPLPNDRSDLRTAAPIEAARARHAAARQSAAVLDDAPMSLQDDSMPMPFAQSAAPAEAQPAARAPVRAPVRVPVQTQRSVAGGRAESIAPSVAAQTPPRTAAEAAAPPPRSTDEQVAMMSELRSMRGLIEQRFGALAFMEKLQRQPRQAQLSQRLLDAGFSPVLIRKLVQGLPDDLDEVTWAASVLERNLLTAELEPALEEVGGVFALIGATGVGKTTSTAKLAAAFATQHGATNLGLVTLDAYRVGAHEQLRTYGRILGVPVHTAHDRASLDDLLDLLSAKRMVLIDTAGMAQRDSRTRELLEMLSHRSINRLLVVNASAQGETIEDQIAAYAAHTCRGLVLSKMDEAVKLGPALDAMIRHKLKVLAVANGQRVPEDWHRLSANALVQRALRAAAAPAWKLDDADVNLIFAGLPAMPSSSTAADNARHATGAATHA